MTLIIREVKTPGDFRDFIFLPAKIHKHHNEWIPPVWMDEKAFFDPLRNKSFTHCDTLMLIALRNGQVVGRIMGIIHHTYNQIRNIQDGRFGFLECYNDAEAAHILLKTIEEWALSKGMKRLVGPYGFSDKDPQGFLVEGFGHRAMIASNCNFPYMIDLVTDAGYSKEIDCIAFKLPISTEIPELHRQIYERAARNTKTRVVGFSSRKEIKKWIRPVLELMNECYTELYGFVPLNDAEMTEFAERYLPILDPRFLKIVLNSNEQLLSFVVALPNFSKGLQRSKGFLFPFGFFCILWEMKRTRQLDLMLGGVKPAHQGTGLEVLMGLHLVEEARKVGLTEMEVHLILETNHKMLGEMHKLNATPHKRFRVFCKPLQP
ncbi:MAG TPA: hypothetical protein VLH16_04040 [Bacteroidales bacterium]|nr:hypothetical protein [Bacteroidales bacterium]